MSYGKGVNGAEKQNNQGGKVGMWEMETNLTGREQKRMRGKLATVNANQHWEPPHRLSHFPS